MNCIIDTVWAWCLGLVTLTSVAAQVCPYNVSACRCSYNAVSCFQLQEIPPLTNGSDVTSVTIAMFDTGNITTLHDGVLPPGLVSLEFTGHPLTNISDDAFNNSATTLQELTISRSDLRNLPPALLSLRNLSSLTIGDTDIYVWDSEILQHIAKTLTELHLPNVGLQNWPDWFSHFHLLTTAELSQNSLDLIPEDAFVYVNNTLQNVRLKQCNLTRIPEVLSTLNNLILLDIGDNSISDQDVDELASFPSAGVIQHLFLQSMKLTTIPELSNMTSLQGLFLDSNQIANSTPGVLPLYVATLHLEYNNLTSVPADIADLRELSALYLAYNDITQVSLDMFPSQLKYLDLSHNQLMRISNPIYEENSLLETLFLNHNPITDIGSSAFKHLVRLQQLDLQSTRLTTLPLTLSSLGQLSILQMSGITSLSCDPPPPQDLLNWFWSFSLGGVDIYGDCNNGVSIYDYLSTSTTRATIPWKYPSRSPGQQDLTIPDSTTATGDAGVLTSCLFQICTCLLVLFSARYYVQL